MKTPLLLLVLTAALVFMLAGCSDNPNQPVTQADQNSIAPPPLAKEVRTSYTFTDYPIAPPWGGEVKIIPGGKMQLKQMHVLEAFVSDDRFMNGRMEHCLSLTIDAVTGEGPCNGSFTVTLTDPTVGGVWEGTYQGYRSKSSVAGEWILPLKVEAHGKGGLIDGWQAFATGTLIVRADDPATFPLPSSWVGTGEGFYKSH